MGVGGRRRGVGVGGRIGCEVGSHNGPPARMGSNPEIQKFFYMIFRSPDGPDGPAARMGSNPEIQNFYIIFRSPDGPDEYSGHPTAPTNIPVTRRPRRTHGESPDGPDGYP